MTDIRPAPAAPRRAPAAQDPSGRPGLRSALPPTPSTEQWPSPTAEELAEVNRPVVEQAKGVLMLRYGIGSYEALAVLLHWAREAQVALNVVARTLVSGVCQDRGKTARSHGWLVRWLEERLRDDVPDPAQV